MRLFHRARSEARRRRIVRKSERLQEELGLRSLSDHGFVPETVLDVGAYDGRWTRKLKRVFPRARVLMVEAQEAKRAQLARVAASWSGEVDFAIALLGPEAKRGVEFHLMETGSSLYHELTAHPRETVELPMRRCDDVVREAGLERVDMIKLDVQGAELAVLEGAAATLRDAEILLLEVAVLPYNRGAPLFAEVVQRLDTLGFALHDIAGFLRAPNGSLSQCDLIFARKDSALRRRLLAAQLRRGAPAGDAHSSRRAASS